MKQKYWKNGEGSNLIVGKRENSREYSIVIAGEDPAGMAAALGAHEQGLNDILLIERDDRLVNIKSVVFITDLVYTCLKKNWPIWSMRIDFIKREYKIYILNTTVIDINAENIDTYELREDRTNKS